MLSSALIVSLLKFVHIWAVIMFVGNSVLGPYRRRRARLTGDPKIIAGTYAIHTGSGPAVTVPWFGVAVASGFTLAWLMGSPILATGWLVWAIALTALVAALFVFRIGPLQRVATAAAQSVVEDGTGESKEHFQVVARKLEPFSHLAHLIFAAILIMVVKPTLPLPW